MMGDDGQAEDTPLLDLRNARKYKYHIAIVMGLCFLFTNLILFTNFMMSKGNAGKKSLMASNSITIHDVYDHAAVTSSSKACSVIGKNILLRGGHAVDATISTLLCVGITNPQSSGIGGGGIFLILSNSSFEPKFNIIDGRETAMQSALFSHPSELSRIIGLPGEIALFADVHRKYGRLPWSVLFEPVIDMCIKGFRVEENMAKSLRKMDMTDPLMRQVFQKDGQWYRTGDIMKRPRLGKTLQLIASDKLTFYSGSLAHDIISDLQDMEVETSAEEFRSYKTIERQPTKVELRSSNLRSFAVPAPFSGSILQFMLALLDDKTYKMQKEYSKDRSLFYHQLIEVLKFGFFWRNHLADPEFEDMTNLTESMTSLKFLRLILSKIDDFQTHDVPYYGNISRKARRDHGTSHVAVISANGDAVSATSTINLSFGSQRMGSRTGIIFNNELEDFSSVHSPFNMIEVGKRPASSMCPIIILNQTDNQLHFVGGASGSELIISAVLNTFSQAEWLHQNLSQAIAKPRVHHELVPNLVFRESGLSEEILEGLRMRGHKLSPHTVMIGKVNAISRVCQKSECILLAAGDPRNNGATSGY